MGCAEQAVVVPRTIGATPFLPAIPAQIQNGTTIMARHARHRHPRHLVHQRQRRSILCVRLMQKVFVGLTMTVYAELAAVVQSGVRVETLAKTPAQLRSSATTTATSAQTRGCSK